MALLTSELTRIKYELGFPAISVAAEPYIGITAIFEMIIQPYLLSGAVTSSATAVVAPTGPTSTTLVLASATGISLGDRLVVDVDARQESAIIETISGVNATLLLSLPHSGTYPVTVEGGESIVRSILRKLVEVEAAQEASMMRAGIKKVDEVEFFPSTLNGGSTIFNELTASRNYWRCELKRILFGGGDVMLGSGGSGCGSGNSIAVY